MKRRVLTEGELRRPGGHPRLVRPGRPVSGIVRPTLEVALTESPARLAKTYRPELGLSLIDL